MPTEFAHDKIVPDQQSTLHKKEQVAEMFNNIAGKYDFLNRFLSGGIDIIWRKKAIQQLKALQPQTILDVATGTADVALMTYARLKPQKIIGIDISEGMLNLGKQKIEKAGLSNNIILQQGDSEHIDFEDNSFDAITVSFGVRNFENLLKGLREMHRVLKPGGKIVILEFSKPRWKPFQMIYNLYLSIIAPAFAQLFSKNKKAYKYLNNSVRAFPEGKQFLTIMHEAGFTQTYLKPLSLGICTIYCGSK
ncbi:bifunctional demethylmenaquinone methyltransferase/2-methoxy-6-polyprenyl-1,4-benzoquinol methylase UbiE [Hydrotalea sandarakina]|jgi:demethylmenaquinone methyltransferase/2-methoxy-6-polyprenyl-1,4-benzoquinol methylase|uniref:Demethylmenaquinone methyltransferase n=1 Tax=Hydrotalea sandarakina TaxID=1004304 RepID=A0A2W7S4J3_9BACT|nr:bifunctional demethylmenaquinone methyltransferase/2-methoxy-6-polyprenyl-1,4-benzoquinol methylase UbiE [Hydrotalea sandarakina]PZX62197.1 demethylmenaquinone methyltransferase/2-methoxy-6-polyprenyl-1,4-benzoquinol methylase [Hydrotalea sandarakina]